MLVVALGFLTVFGLVLPHGDCGAAFRDSLLGHALFRPIIIVLWGIVIVEGLLGLRWAPDAWPARVKRLLLTALLPPLRMITASSKPRGWLWLPAAGWRPVGEKTSERLEQRLALFKPGARCAPTSPPRERWCRGSMAPPITSPLGERSTQSGG